MDTNAVIIVLAEPCGLDDRRDIFGEIVLQEVRRYFFARAIRVRGLPRRAERQQNRRHGPASREVRRAAYIDWLVCCSRRDVLHVNGRRLRCTPQRLPEISHPLLPRDGKVPPLRGGWPRRPRRPLVQWPAQEVFWQARRRSGFDPAGLPAVSPILHAPAPSHGDRVEGRNHRGWTAGSAASAPVKRPRAGRRVRVGPRPGFLKDGYEPPPAP